MNIPHESIKVRGARVNNLRGVDVDIPKRALTAFTGVSGSGKSSLVFGVIAAESRRLINETYSAFVQTFMPTQPRPDVDALANLSAAIVVDQERMGANIRSTVGTATDANSFLRLVFSRLSTPHVGAAGMFSFNLPGGMCPTCEGTGTRSMIDETAVVDRELSLAEGAILAPQFAVGSWYYNQYAQSGKLDPNKPLKDYTPEEWEFFWLSPPQKVRSEALSMNVTFEGLLPKVTKMFQDKDPERERVKAVKEFLLKAFTFGPCPDCHGTRLAEGPRTATVRGVTFPECTAMEIAELAEWVRGLDDPEVAPVVQNLQQTLDGMIHLGLGYLSLDRQTGTLSGGESQRVKMVRHLGSALSDLTYVFDEPTIGLHAHDIAAMNEILLQLRDKGNTVLVVEHKPEVMRIADHLVDLGPGAGSEGGQIVYEGDFAGLAASGTLTGEHLGRPHRLRTEVRPASGVLEIRGANQHNLKNVDVDVPLGVLVAVSGVAGSGKSTLIHGALDHVDGVRVLDQGAIRGSRRSMPATYTGALDHIRKLFAKETGQPASMFSPNSEGACPECQGMGVIYTDLAMMAGVETPCETCEGRRFTDEVLGYTYKGHSIFDVLDMPIRDAVKPFPSGKLAGILRNLEAVGLGYIRLGQPLTTLSGGERQRLKLSLAIAEGTGIYVLDEPTSGLHMADIARMTQMLHGLVDAGNSVIVIEHNLDVIAQADWVIDLGPGGGSAGGEVIFEGTPEALAASGTLTGRYLAERYA